VIGNPGQFEAARRIAEKLREEGYEAYLAGGCVRDLLLGRDPVDYDVATSATPDVVLDLFPRTFAVGAHFGVVLVAASDEQAREKPVEVATFRSDGAYSDGRHPDEVRYTLLAEEDVQRRDFTINGLLLDLERFERLTEIGSQAGREKATADPSLRQSAMADRLAQDDKVNSAQDDAAIFGAVALRGAVLDHVGGLADLESGLVRAIGRPTLRFEEDRLRLLRAVRFAARFGFEIEEGTRAAIRALAPRIASVSRERVRDELTKMLTEGRARRAFELLDETGLLHEVLPEIERMKGVEQPPQFHPEGDVWIHTLMLLEQLEPGCSMTLAWGALLHDVGKPSTFRRGPDRIRFDSHVEVGSAMAAAIFRRFRFSNDETRQVLALVDNHMRFMDAGRMKESTLKRFFRLDRFDEHLELHRMDCMAASGNLDHWNFVRERREQMPEEVVRPRLLITGRELIAAGYQPGPAFSEMLHAAEDAQLEGAVQTAEEALRLIRERFGEGGETG
jgi:poly(A) polymerase